MKRGEKEVKKKIKELIKEIGVEEEIENIRRIGEERRGNIKMIKMRMGGINAKKEIMRRRKRLKSKRISVDDLTI